MASNVNQHLQKRTFHTGGSIVASRGPSLTFILFVDYNLTSVDKHQEHARGWWGIYKIGPPVFNNRRRNNLNFFIKC